MIVSVPVRKDHIHRSLGREDESKRVNGIRFAFILLDIKEPRKMFDMVVLLCGKIRNREAIIEPLRLAGLL